MLKNPLYHVDAMLGFSGLCLLNPALATMLWWAFRMQGNTRMLAWLTEAEKMNKPTAKIYQLNEYREIV